MKAEAGYSYVGKIDTVCGLTDSKHYGRLSKPFEWPLSVLQFLPFNQTGLVQVDRRCSCSIDSLFTYAL